jgi:hypothetical protein
LGWGVAVRGVEGQLESQRPGLFLLPNLQQGLVGCAASEAATVTQVRPDGAARLFEGPACACDQDPALGTGLPAILTPSSPPDLAVVNDFLYQLQDLDLAAIAETA